MLPWWSGGGGQVVVGETTSVTWQAGTQRWVEKRLLLLFSPSFFQSFASSSSLWRVVPER